LEKITSEGFFSRKEVGRMIFNFCFNILKLSLSVFLGKKFLMKIKYMDPSFFGAENL
jgi:hypothetical protein